MPYDDPEPDDPNVLVGVSVPADRDSVRYMAETFADEFAILGYDEARLVGLFHNPFYGGAHEALRVLGEETIRRIVHESLAFWRDARIPAEKKKCRK